MTFFRAQRAHLVGFQVENEPNKATRRIKYANNFLLSVLREEFRLEPQHTRVAQGETVLLECGPPKGVPEPTVGWRKNGQKLDVETSKRIRIVDGGNLAIQDVRQTDEGQYQCIAKNLVGVRESAMAFLKVHGKCLEG